METVANWKWPQTALCILLASLMGFQAIPSDAIWLSIFWLVSVFCVFLTRHHGKPGLLEVYAVVSIAVLFLSVMYSHWMWVSFWVACSLSLIPIGFMVFYRGGSEELIQGFKLSVVVIAVGNSAYSVFMSVNYIGRNGGLFADANVSANLSLVAVLILSQAIVLGAKRRYDSIRWMFLAFLLFSIFTMQSRAAVLLLMLSLSLIFIFSERKMRKRLLAIFSVVGLSYFLSNFMFANEVAENLSPLSRVESFSYRIDLWASAFQLLMESTWFGSGLGTFSLLYPAVRESTEIGSVGFFVHNDYLQLVLELGVLSFIVFMIFPVLASTRLVFLVWRDRSSGSRTEGLFILSVLFVVSAHSFVNFIIYHPLLAFIFGAFLGVGFFRFFENSAFRSPSMSDSNKYLKISVALMLVLGVFGVFSSIVDQMARNSIHQANRAGLMPSLANDSYYSLLAYSYFSPLNTSIVDYLIVSETNTAIPMADMELGRELALKTLSRIDGQALLKSPNCIQDTAKARLVWALGEKDEAIDVLVGVLSVAPDCEQARLVISEALVKLGRSDEAVGILNEGINRIRFKEVLESESRALFIALEEALRAAGREDEADAVRVYLGLSR